MRVTVDRRICEAHGQCEATAPHLFRLDDDAELVLTFDGTDVPASDEMGVRRAISYCPVAALQEIPGISC